MLIREHRGSLKESMDTLRIVYSVEELLNMLRHVTGDDNIVEHDLNFKHQGYDERIHWDVYLLTIDSYGVFGMTDSTIERLRKEIS